MKLKLKDGRELAFSLVREAVGLLRLLQHHAPLLLLVGHEEDGRPHYVHLAQLIIPHSDELPMDVNRAQLQRLSK